MAVRVASPCLEPRCPEPAESRGRCGEHARERERRRGTSAARGYDARHRRWRAMILARDSICKDCGKAPSTEADHITPLSQGGGWSLDNGQGLCKPCHSRKTLAERVR